MTLTECCEIILQECNQEFAKSYAMAWLDGRVEERAKHYRIPLAEAKQSQALYLLGNIERWRGGNAKVVRKALQVIAREG